jgi:hypothetical protein
VEGPFGEVALNLSSDYWVLMMYWLYPSFYIEDKFGTLEKKDKKTDINRD